MLKSLAFITPLIWATATLAQNAPPPSEGTGEPISILMFGTFLATLILAIAVLLWFLRKRSNRNAADKALNPNNPANR